MSTVFIVDSALYSMTLYYHHCSCSLASSQLLTLLLTAVALARSLSTI
jgi:hypothetical protein